MLESFRRRVPSEPKESTGLQPSDGAGAMEQHEPECLDRLEHRQRGVLPRLALAAVLTTLDVPDHHLAPSEGANAAMCAVRGRRMAAQHVDEPAHPIWSPQR
jgi:hypothetical protein